MADFAIIQSGSKQYKVGLGDTIEVELLEGKDIEFETLLTSKSGKVTIGKPYIKTKVKGSILGMKKGEKIHIRTFKAKSRHRRHIGHRQKYSVVEIKSL
jgi:large subunit ribosomal protein L21